MQAATKDTRTIPPMAYQRQKHIVDIQKPSIINRMLKRASVIVSAELWVCFLQKGCSENQRKVAILSRLSVVAMNCATAHVIRLVSNRIQSPNKRLLFSFVCVGAVVLPSVFCVCAGVDIIFDFCIYLLWCFFSFLSQVGSQ